MINIDLKGRVMARIYIQYVKNVLASQKESFLFLALMGMVFMYVSVPSVLHNMPMDDFPSTYRFLSSAVANTDLAVQIILVSLFISAGISTTRLVRRFNRTLSKLSRLSRLYW